MSSGSRPPLEDPVLSAHGIAHGFGQRSSAVPATAVFPRQVHGVSVLRVDPESASGGEADAVVTRLPGVTLGIVTADCVPILIATEDGDCVGAIHAGWRGLAAGVIEAGLEAVCAEAGCVPSKLLAAVGPAAGPCCYEVDAPVRAGLAVRYSALLDSVLERGRPDRFMLDLPGLACRIIEQSGSEKARIGVTHRVCTICDAARFESYRRDGARAGRLRHFITRPAPIPRQG